MRSFKIATRTALVWTLFGSTAALVGGCASSDPPFPPRLQSWEAESRLRGLGLAGAGEPRTVVVPIKVVTTKSGGYVYVAVCGIDARAVATALAEDAMYRTSEIVRITDAASRADVEVRDAKVERDFNHDRNGFSDRSWRSWSNAPVFDVDGRPDKIVVLPFRFGESGRAGAAQTSNAGGTGGTEGMSDWTVVTRTSVIRDPNLNQSGGLLASLRPEWWERARQRGDASRQGDLLGVRAVEVSTVVVRAEGE